MRCVVLPHQMLVFSGSSLFGVHEVLMDSRVEPDKNIKLHKRKVRLVHCSVGALDEVLSKNYQVKSHYCRMENIHPYPLSISPPASVSRVKCGHLVDRLTNDTNWVFFATFSLSQAHFLDVRRKPPV